jgi:hypothetical protein
VTDDSDVVREFPKEPVSPSAFYDAVPAWPHWVASWREFGGRRVRGDFVTHYQGREYGVSQDADGSGEDGHLVPRFSLYLLERVSDQPSSGWSWRVLFRHDIPEVTAGEEASSQLAVIRKRLPDLLVQLSHIVEPPSDDADLVGELPWRWAGSVEAFYDMVPNWPRWTVYRSYLGTERVKRSFVTCFDGREYAIGQDASADSEGTIRLLPTFFICALERPHDPPLADWFWHVIYRGAIPGGIEGAEETARLASLRRRLPELLIRMNLVLSELGLSA